jgi:predicted lysophospholipase L1 biosynthesis ABC-type transport system permease subunit
MSGEKLAEVQALQKAAGAHDVSRENAESELFGSKPSSAEEKAADKGHRKIEATTTPGVAPAMRDLGESLGGKLQREEARSRVFPPGEVETGVVLNAAVILKDPKKIAETMAAIEAQGAKDGLTLKAIDWQKAAGLIGQFIDVARNVLYIAILIIFMIALVIINNAMVMATLERVREIGTLRAIGAQRRFILAMLVIEAIVVGMVFGGLGAGLGAVLVSIIGKVGIPAKSDVWFFFFSGPRLYPFIGTSNVVAAFIIVLLVSAFSSFYPAWLAMRVTPRQAMQEDE